MTKDQALTLAREWIAKLVEGDSLVPFEHTHPDGSISLSRVLPHEDGTPNTWDDVEFPDFTVDKAVDADVWCVFQWDEGTIDCVTIAPGVTFRPF